MQFEHEVDYTAEIDTDEGRLSMVDGKLREQGEALIDGRTIHFEEIWLPEPARADTDTGTVTVACCKENGAEEQVTGYFVQVADYAIAMFAQTPTGSRDFVAACWQLAPATDDGTWRLVAHIGNAQTWENVRASRADGQLPPGWQIQVAQAAFCAPNTTVSG